MLTAAQVAEQLGISSRKVYQLANTGKLPCSHPTGRRAVRFAETDVDEYRKSALPAPVSIIPLRVLREFERLRQRMPADDRLPPLPDDLQTRLDMRARRLRLAPWASGSAVRAIYAEARRRTIETGVPHHVDHIVPLQGELVSGLHVETNLRVLPRAENLQKRNRHEDFSC